MEIVYYDSICESCDDRFQFRVPGSLFEEFKIRLAEQKESILCDKCDGELDDLEFYNKPIICPNSVWDEVSDLIWSGAIDTEAD
jgi:Zn finger protein HypA/HybF involved in hydrogenase expression